MEPFSFIIGNINNITRYYSSVLFLLLLRNFAPNDSWGERRSRRPNKRILAVSKRRQSVGGSARRSGDHRNGSGEQLLGLLTGRSPRAASGCPVTWPANCSTPTQAVSEYRKRVESAGTHYGISCQHQLHTRVATHASYAYLILYIVHNI